MRAEDLTLADVEALKGPAEGWAGRCFEIAYAIEKAGLVEGRAVYGHWRGRVARGTLFANRAIIQHGWVDLGPGIDFDGVRRVLDPTRWVFEGVKPYLFVGEPEFICMDFDPEDGADYLCQTCDHVDDEHERHGFFRPCLICRDPYDEGGNELRMSMERPVPAFDDSRGIVPMSEHLSPQALDRVYGLLRRMGPVTVLDAGWLANLALDRLEPYAAEVYNALKAEDLIALVPLDNRLKVLPEDR